jgi:hypothetical protein
MLYVQATVIRCGCSHTMYRCHITCATLIARVPFHVCCRRIVQSMHQVAPDLRGADVAASEVAGRAVLRCLTLALEAINLREVGGFGWDCLKC